MGFLTWQNVPVGDLSAAQEGFRTASSLFDRAIRSGQEGIASYQQIQNNEQAFKQQTADKIMAAKMMAIQDPEEYRKAMAAGLVDPVIAQNVSLDAMARANKQFDVLQGRAQADQNLLSAKQQFDALGYKINREQEGDRLSDAAMPILNEALKVAVNDRAKALAMIEQSPMQLEDKAKAVAMIDTQYQDRTAERLGWARHAQDQRQFEIANAAAQLKQELRQSASGDSAAQGRLLDEYAKKNKDKYGAYIAEMVNRDLSREDPNFYKEVASLNANMGGNSNEVSSGNPYARQISLIDSMVRDEAANLSPGAKIIEKAKPFAMATAADMALSVKKDFPGFDTNEFTKVIRETRSKLPKDVKVSEGELAHMILNSMQESSFYNLDNFAKNADIVQKDMDNLVKSISSSRMEVNEYNDLLKTQAKLAELSQQRQELLAKKASVTARASMGRKGDTTKIDEDLAKLDKRMDTLSGSAAQAAQRQAKREAAKKDAALSLVEDAKKAAEKEAADKLTLGKQNTDDWEKIKARRAKTGSFF